MAQPKIGVLLLNLGTPGSPEVSAVRTYLKAFLDDKRVVDIPAWMRKILLYAFILPFRPQKSAKAYAAIWDKKRGSPLLFHSEDLSFELQIKLPSQYQVALGMRYGKPSIEKAIEALLNQKCEHILVLPLFPQYASSASGSAIEEVFALLSKKNCIPAITVLPSFFEDPAFIDAKAQLIAPYLQNNKVDKVIFSYHSLPQRQIKKTDSDCHIMCLENKPCEPIKEGTKWCYRAQCYQTSSALAKQLQLSEKDYIVAFQSRLGRTPWIGPDVMEIMPKLIQDNVKNIVVACPSFVADCLETLEEIGMRAKETWRDLGGEQFTLVPCLNASPHWVQALAKMIEKQTNS